MSKLIELQIETLPGPTHHYGGLAYGNVAAMEHKGVLSNPKAAALQSLAKVEKLIAFGVPIILTPPPKRPYLSGLKSLGFIGTEKKIIEDVSQYDKTLLYPFFSSAYMWMANSATVIPSLDACDNKVHFQVANCHCHFHRSFEWEFNHKIFKRIFKHQVFSHHPPLPLHNNFGDEGAANHMRFFSDSKNNERKALNVFVYNQEAVGYPARQNKNASQLTIQKMKLNPDQAMLVSQNKKTVSRGVFHNDVIAFSHKNYFVVHEEAFEGGAKTIEEIRAKYSSLTHEELNIAVVNSAQFSVKEAVETYVFNSQLIELASREKVLVMAKECFENKKILNWVKEVLVKRFKIKHLLFQDLNQSMKNGGGPACLRLRVPLMKKELSLLPKGLFLNQQKLNRLKALVAKYYRDKLLITDLHDPKLVVESKLFYQKITEFFNLGNIYEK